MITDLYQLPKIELHLHLDCTLNFNTAKKIIPSLNYNTFERDFLVPHNCNDLSDYLRVAVKGSALMQDRKTLRMVTLDLFEQLKRDNNIYTEVRFAPLEQTKKGLSPEEVAEIVNTALEEGAQEYGIEVNVIFCTLRHYSREQSMQTVKLVEKFQGSRIVGFDIASDEAGYPIDNHIAAFEYAKSKGIPCTAHAGEAKGAESVEETIRHFQPSRIGHGVRSIENNGTIQLLKEKNIHLEVCPTSNLRTNIVQNMKDHPIQRLKDSGVSLSINTDARSILGVTLASEYELIQDYFQWEKSDFLHTNLEALKHAFIGQDKKNELQNILLDSYQVYDI